MSHEHPEQWLACMTGQKEAGTPSREQPLTSNQWNGSLRLYGRPQKQRGIRCKDGRKRMLSQRFIVPEITTSMEYTLA